MKILITGGCGFVGSAFIRHALDQHDCELMNMDLLTYAANPAAVMRAAAAPYYRFFHADIADAGAVTSALEQFSPDAVINFAAETHVDRSIESATPFLHTNVNGTQVLLERCTAWWRNLPLQRRASFRYIQVSTDEVYGDRSGISAATIASAFRPSSPYAASKAAADHLVQAWRRTYGLPTLISHCGNNFGPWQFPEKLVPLAIARALSGVSIPLYGDGKQLRDWIHVDDHARGLMALLLAGEPGAEHLFSGGAEISNFEVASHICTSLDDLRPPPANLSSHTELIRYVADRPGHDRRYAIDDRTTRVALNWKPQIPFLEGITATVRWYVDYAAQWRTPSAQDYGGKRLGAPT